MCLSVKFDSFETFESLSKKNSVQNSKLSAIFHEGIPLKTPCLFIWKKNSAFCMEPGNPIFDEEISAWSGRQFATKKKHSSYCLSSLSASASKKLLLCWKLIFVYTQKHWTGWKNSPPHTVPHLVFWCLSHKNKTVFAFLCSTTTNTWFLEANKSKGMIKEHREQVKPR